VTVRVPALLGSVLAVLLLASPAAARTWATAFGG